MTQRRRSVGSRAGWKYGVPPATIGAAPFLLLPVVALIVALLLARWPGSRQPAPPSAANQGEAAADWRQHVYMGLPQPQTSYRLLVNRGYAVGYSESRKDPLWVAYRLFPVSDPPKLPRPHAFEMDPRTEAGVLSGDYKPGAGRFDRGHMAPNHAIATRYGHEAQVETFLMSNICPQAACLNEGTWEAFEKVVADDWGERGEVYVITGPIFCGAAPGGRGGGPVEAGGAAGRGQLRPEFLPAGIEIPEAFFTIVVDPAGVGGSGDSRRDAASAGLPQVLAIVMDQSVRGPHELREFVTTVAEIERRTGLAFFPELPADARATAENVLPGAEWAVERWLEPHNDCRLERR